MNIIYAGTPFSSSKILKHLIDDPSINIKGVITKPDKRGKRGKDLLESEVCKVAKDADLQIFKPQKLNESKFVKQINLLDVDYIVVVAYGNLIPGWLLEHPKIMAINIHFSILPKYRGSSPIQSTLLNGDRRTGVTFMKMSKKLDEGDIISTYNLDILADDNKITLENRLTDLSIEKINEVLIKTNKKDIAFKKQNHDMASYCEKIFKENSVTNFDDSSINIINKFKAFFEWPGMSFIYNDTVIKIHGIQISREKSCNSPGTIDRIDKSGLYINTRDNKIVITHLQFPNKNKITSLDVFNSYSSFFK